MTVEAALTDQQDKTKASFAERRESLFERIVATAHTWSEPDRLDAVARVFEHSAEDGRRLAARLSFTPKQYREVILGSTSFALKHPEIVFAFTKKYKELEQKGTSSQSFDEHKFSTMMAELAWEGRFEPKRFVLEGDKAKARFLQEQTHHPVSVFPFSEIDDLYLDAFMQRRPIKVNEEIPEAERNRLSNGELMAERYLEGIEPLLEKRYYVGPITDAFPQYAHEPIFHGSHVTEEKLREFFEKYHLPVEATLKRFASARIGTFREIDDVRRTVTSQELVKEIKKKLPEGFSLVLDREARKYRVEREEKKTEDEKWKSIENDENWEDEYEKNAMDQFEELLKQGADFNAVCSRLAGFDGIRAWRIRKRVEDEGAVGASTILAESLAGIVSPRAQEMRERIRSKTGGLWKSWISIDSPEAWKEREIAEAAGVYAPFLLRSIAGLDCPEAWEMRTRLQGQCTLEQMAQSIIGIDCPEAWNIRRAWRDEHNFGPMLISLGGLDTQEAWEMRDLVNIKAGSQLNENSLLLESLAGVNSPRAKKMRNEIQWHPFLPEAMAHSLSGVFSPAINQYRMKLLQNEDRVESINGFAGIPGFLFRPKTATEKKKTEESDIVPPTGAWQNDLDLLNLVTDPTLAGWREHQQKNQLSPEEALKRKREAAEHTQKYADRLVNDTRTDREVSRELLATNPAIPDRSPERLAQLLLEQMLPSEAAKTRQSFFDRFKSKFSSSRHGRPEISSGFAPQQAYDGAGGGAEELADTRAVLEARQSMDDFLVSNAYGKYNLGSRQWEKVYFLVRRAHPEPAREVTLTCLNVQGLTHVQLPLPLDARLITERLRGLTKQDQEIPLEAVVDSLGAVTVEVPKNVVRIVYSLEQPAIPEPLADPSQKSFDAFVRNFERAHDGKDLRTMLAKLPHDVVAEVHSQAFQALSPKQRVQHVEALVRSLGWYDRHNEETREEKNGQAPNEQILICEERLNRLHERSNNPAMQHKRFAGVCADFALITCALLREAGIPAGMMRGLVMEGKVAQMKDRHATAFVPWPDGKGGIRLVAVDGTPSEDPVASHVSRPTLVQLEEQSQEAITDQVAMAEETIQKIIQAAQAHDVETIRKLKNGKLEQALNVILQYEVKHSHLQAIERVFDVYWYGGLKHLDPIQDEIELRKAWEEEVEAQRQSPSAQEASGSAGTHLLEVVREFSARFRRSGFAKTQADVFIVLDRIANLSSQNLSDVERRALVAVIEYLRAQKMK